MKIRCKAMCVFAHEGSILVQQGVDVHPFSRPLGGSIEFGEQSSETIVREIREEISAEIKDLRFLGVLENVFWYQSNQCHEIVFIYDAKFVDDELYYREKIIGEEADGAALVGLWRRLDSFNESDRLVPEGLRELLQHVVTAPSSSSS